MFGISSFAHSMLTSRLSNLLSTSESNQRCKVEHYVVHADRSMSIFYVKKVSSTQQPNTLNNLEKSTLRFVEIEVSRTSEMELIYVQSTVKGQGSPGNVN